MNKYLKRFCLFLAFLTFPLASVFPAATPPALVSSQEIEPVVILGGGVGGLTSSLYLARAGQSPLVIEGKNPGGLITQSHSVQNWPGEIQIEGQELASKMHAQAEANGVRFLSAEVIRVDFSKRPFQITIRTLGPKPTEKTVQALNCIIAMGAEPNFLQVPGETGPQGYWGKGVTNCAICDGNLYQDQIVGVVGGSDAAVLEALYLSKIAKKVYVFVRKDRFRAKEEKRLEQLLQTPNVEVRYQTRVTEIQGDGNRLTHVLLQEKGQKPVSFALDGLFLAIGSTPNTKLFQGSLELDEKGYIVLKKDQQTSVKGVYAVGDIVDPTYKQAISAAGDGAKAALQAQQDLSDRAAKKEKGTELTQKSGEILEVVSIEQFEKELKQATSPVVVDFYASWCGPCKRLSPLLEESALHLEGKIRFLKVNVDQMAALAKRYQIQSMPTVLVFDQQGKVKEKKVGADQIALFLDDLHQSAESENK